MGIPEKKEGFPEVKEVNSFSVTIDYSCTGCTKRVLWFSHHEPSKVQQKELAKSLDSNLTIIQVNGEVKKSSSEIIEVMDWYDCEELVAVVPYPLLEGLIGLHDVEPIKPIMKRRYVRKNGRKRPTFEFLYYKRFTEVVLDGYEL